MSDDEETPRIDLADRYQEMVQLQVESLQNFDNKAWRAARVIGILLGVAITSLSLVLSSKVDAQFTNIPSVLLLFAGVLCVIISLGFSIISYLSTVFGFGPNTEIGRRVSGSQTDFEEYQSTILRSYTHTIDINQEVLEAKSRRLRYTLAFLLTGILYLAAAILVLLWKPATFISYDILILVTIANILILYYIISKRYTVLDGDEDDSDDGD